MRVLHAFKDYSPPTNGGVEKHINEVVHGIRGIDFAVLTSSRSRRLVVDDDFGVPIIRTAEFFRPVSTPVTPSWPRYLRDPAFDLAHFHVPNPFGEMAFLTSGTRTPLLVTFHAEIIGRRLILPFFSPFQQEFLKRAGRVVVSSPRLVETSTMLAPHRNKTEVIPFGIRAQDWAAPSPEADKLREQHRRPIMLFLGRLSYYKGIDVLLKAIRAVDGTCLIVGDGPKRADLEAQSRTLGLAGKVLFCGEVSDERRSAFYHAADVFVLPSTSRAETYGIAMLEAMACGRPAVSTELGTGTSWVNRHGETGLVVPPGDAGALATALNEVLKNPARKCEMGDAAASRVREHFTLQKMLDSLESLYRSL